MAYYKRAESSQLRSHRSGLTFGRDLRTGQVLESRRLSSSIRSADFSSSSAMSFGAKRDDRPGAKSWMRL
jgi:hypothetical protein